MRDLALLVFHMTVNRHRTGALDVFSLSVWSNAQNHRSAGSRSAPIRTPP
jgi:hypothetical protein